ncbi:MAG: site-specific DNA-methyltransferase [Betaproteobacteria bacterium]|nr:site-specific DNA-methyltransferase [Betaproteobacteria bacterium]
MATSDAALLQQLDKLSAPELRRLLAEHLTTRKLGLTWERDAIAHDRALNADVVLPRVVPEWSHTPEGCTAHRNLVIEGDNFDSLRLLRSTHAGKVRIIYIDPPYNTGNKDWVYNDNYVGANDRWRHSQWLEFLYQRLSLARELLTADGVILVSINDENRSRLELLMDEVFPGRRLGSLVWRTKDTGNDLTQRFSHVHEHVLVYGNAGFSFNGRATDRSKFRNPDKDVRGDWSPQPLTKAHDYTVRENTYYPIQDPDTGYWYPCDPNRVWAYASEEVIRRMKNGDEAAVQAALAALRSDTMEALIAKRLIYFPPCKLEDVMIFDAKADLLAAIAAGKGPMLPKKKTPLLRADLPDIDFWVGKPIAPGRPSRKEHWSAKPEAERLAPVSSWIAGMNEDSDDEDVDLVLLRSARGGVATEEIKNVLGSKAFPYPKPLSLIKGLLSQATRPSDIVLDFFAGSGTTGQAVLELNAEDGGQRRFILCSSTEATTKEPDKNLCRDVCAERLRRVISGYGGKPGFTLEQGGEFAYLQLDKLDGADVALDATAQHVATLLSMRNAGVAPVETAQAAIQIIAKGADWLLVLCTHTGADVLSALQALPTQHSVARLVVVAPRPKAVALWLAERGIEAQALSLREVLTQGQGDKKARNKG